MKFPYYIGVGKALVVGMLIYFAAFLYIALS